MNTPFPKSLSYTFQPAAIESENFSAEAVPACDCSYATLAVGTHKVAEGKRIKIKIKRNI